MTLICREIGSCVRQTGSDVPVRIDADAIALELFRLKGRERSGLAARSTYRYRYPGLSSQR
jgi:hypothetical protein